MMKKMLCAAMAAVFCLSLLSACAGGKENSPSQAPGKSVDLGAFGQTVTETHELGGFMQLMNPSDPDMGEMMADMLNNYYPGLSDLDLMQMKIYMSMISFSSGEFALVQAKSAEDAAKVKEIFQARIDSKTTEGPNNYPEEVELWQRSSKIVTNGNNVMLVCAEDCDAIVNEFNALFQ